MRMACTLASPRRRAFQAGAALAASALVAPAAWAVGGVTPTTLTPDQALAALMNGNARFRAGQVQPNAADPARRTGWRRATRPSLQSSPVPKAATCRNCRSMLASARPSW